VGVRNLIHRLTAPAHELDEERLREFVGRFGGTAIADIQPREEFAAVGEISTVRVVPRPGGSSWLEATVSDASGKRLIVLWTGRRKIAGVEPGRRLLVAGRAAPTGPGGRLCVYNPTYELL